MNSRLQNARLDLQLTQVQVAAIVEISETSYQRIEYDLQTPSLKTAMRIARALNSTVEELFDIIDLNVNDTITTHKEQA